MKTQYLLLILCSSPCWAHPKQDSQVVLGRPNKSPHWQPEHPSIPGRLSEAEIYTYTRHPDFADYQLRAKESKLCDNSVKQHTGYLDITSGKHLFFWFFEARHTPERAPLTLWLNGGPGCSSTTGLLFELGPCRISAEGKNVTFNPYSWTTQSNMIFLDQPVNTGYSYSDDGSTVSTSPIAAEDIYAFLQLFLATYPKYGDMPFHLAGESYAATILPNVGKVIHERNKELSRVSPPFDAIQVRRINLASIILGNGITEPYTQMGSIPQYACDGPYPMYNDTAEAECASLRQKATKCQGLTQACYQFNTITACASAGAYCFGELFGTLDELGISLYDVRRKCELDQNLCYKELNWVTVWMNDPTNKLALGIPTSLNFTPCNMDVNRAFFEQGDAMHNSAALLPDLINDGIKLLVYAGNADAMCNFIGNQAWMMKLNHRFHDELQKSLPLKWITPGSGRIAGEVRSAGGNGNTAGNVTFVQIYEAGHMVSYDQPEAALDMFARWIQDAALTHNSDQLGVT